MVTLGLLRALKQHGWRVSSAKVGPDYIDPRFHELASGRPCPSLDLWAMGTDRCRSILAAQAEDADIVVVEGVMGLFDGPQGAPGSTADLAEQLVLPIVLVVDCSHQAQSVAALVHGFKSFRPQLDFAGVILNKVATPRHALMLTDALQPRGIRVLGCLERREGLQWPSRHLGLVQAGEHPSTEQFISRAADAADAAGLVQAVSHLGADVDAAPDCSQLLSPPGQRIAVALDQAFSFAYPCLLQSWQQAGAEVTPFSPLADEPARVDADFIYLPGGYPELHAAKLSNNKSFRNSLQISDAVIFGECGGYMVLGESIIDAQGAAHAMAGLLPVVTSFEKRKLHLGYRRLTPFGGPWKTALRAHEFHYSTVASEGAADPLFAATDAAGNDLGMMGVRRGKVMGSYAHIIASEAA